ncbi:interferon-induced very large GTPase 1-like isoform X1 [Erpetoichthys calabaricus]|uniref:interferon-induced very large GTPase 1-like isoform X1 n=1 Tax=Erpetoichthys calabaricus TaxID=27687 RepID=UPI0022345D51|nr:interferon-induced very large GTPase 1-like isoform X1 [Erpetoichthys calabaricus]XP_051779264.1 interferon-induced very large GTPase 1-like isoform X1 [Erpetoichthys calabaricus]XP_051779268.1 interferon-induced very large GTPase 1-like isoform X1 [Erpetoichthys calabaricus]
MASALCMKDQLTCRVCLELLEDPVDLPCGHTYCMKCILKYWSHLDNTEVHDCPHCKNIFQCKPVLVNNTLFAQMAEIMRKSSFITSSPNQDEEEVRDAPVCKKISEALHRKVKDVGLNPEYWMPILNDHLGVTDLKSLENLGREQYCQVEGYIREQNERGPLCKLMNISHEYAKSEMPQNNREERESPTLENATREKNNESEEGSMEEKKTLRTLEYIETGKQRENGENLMVSLDSKNVENQDQARTKNLSKKEEICNKEQSNSKAEEFNNNNINKTETSIQEVLGGEKQCEREVSESKNNNTEIQTEQINDTSNTENRKEIKEAAERDNREKKKKDFFLLLEKMHIVNLYPKLMEKIQVIVISKTSKSNTQPENEDDLPRLYLQKLIMMDYRMRNLICDKIYDNQIIFKELQSQRETETQLTLDDFLSDTTSEDLTETGTPYPEHIHPMDLQMALLHCADDFLRQYLYSKLALCQYAVPFLIPSPCTTEIELPLWAFHQINSSCKSQETKTYKVFPAVQVETQIVSFIRLGNSLVSKSKIMNMVLNRQRHSIFFNKDCRGSTRGCLLMDGVVEMSWYNPGGKEDDIFEDCIAFTNLHGDARNYDRQVSFLNDISAVNVVLLSDSDLNEDGKAILKGYFESPQPLICLHTDKEAIQANKSGIKLRIGVKNRNEAELTDELVSVLRSFLSQSKKTFHLESCSDIALRHGFLVDEESKNCKEGKALADKLAKCLKKRKLLERKEAFLPLQGHMWHKWCQKDKELYRLKQKGNKSIEQYRSDIETEKKKIREDQLKRAFPLNELMTSLIKILSSQSQQTKQYFLQWLMVFLDDMSRDAVSELQLRYHEKLSELLKKQKNEESEQRKDKLQSDLDTLSSQITDSSLGLEHILREMGQIFEASKTGRVNDSYISSLPKIAAELIMSGHPLELMDGDAVYVPVTWISSVLDEVKETLGDVRLFVLSVLGLQSSGKSTLLNAMFGLQFAVSAGRCTKGAFMQLIKIAEEIRDEVKYNYILVVDTEGLRATELSNKTTLAHDNELATFVIGLGNLTIINIFGENPSEIQDILQIVVQAFLRMKKVKLSPSCVFVHQNVGDTVAREKNTDARRVLQQNLDRMTRVAAEEEECNIKYFNDVIRFDVNDQTYYFVHLWEGNPPMAPPNPSYSQNVQDLKNDIVNAAKQDPTCNILKISQFKIRVKDLWKSLLTENFVFNFKNSLEIAAYRKLEEKYLDWTWTLRSKIYEVQNKTINKIKNTSNTQVSISMEVEETYTKVKEEIGKYFADDEKLIQWKSNIETRFDVLKNDLSTEMKKTCEELIKAKTSRQKVDENRFRHEEKLMEQSKELAEKLRTTNPTEDELREEFEKLWIEWEKEASRDCIRQDKINIVKDVQDILYEKFKAMPNAPDKIQTYLTSDQSATFHSNPDSTKKFSIIPSFLQTVISFIPLRRKTKQPSYKVKCTLETIPKLSDQYIEFQPITNKIAETVLDYIDKKKKEENDYNSAHIHEILKLVSQKMSAYKEEEEYKLSFKQDYKFELSLQLCAIAIEPFTEMQKRFWEKNDPVLYLKSKRDSYYKMFKTLCHGLTSVNIFSEYLGSKLKTAIHQAVCDQVCIDVANIVRQNHPPLKESKIKLEYHLLKELAEKEDFEKFCNYIEFPKIFFKKYISSCVDNYCKDNKTLKTISSQRLKEFESLVSKAASSATKAIEKVIKAQQDNRKMKVKVWLDKFCKELEDSLVLPGSDFRHVEHLEIGDLNFLQDSMSKAVAQVMRELNKSFDCISLTELTNVKELPHDILSKHLSGCWVQCPFCAAICTNSIEGHDGDHSVPFHRPIAVNGWRFYKTEYLCVDICTSSVASDRFFRVSDTEIFPYKEYRKAGPQYACWNIVPDESELKYWKWFVCNFQVQLEEKYKKKFDGLGKIPTAWKEIKKEDALGETEKLLLTGS